MLIATRGIRARQNSYGFRAIWSWKNFSTDLSILRDLLRNWFLSKIKLCSFFPGQEFTYIKNCFHRIEALPKGFHLPIFDNWGQNPYGFRTIWSSFSDDFFDGSFKSAEKSRECFTWRLYENFCTDFLRRTSAGIIWILCRRPSRKIVFFLGRTSTGWKNFTYRRPSRQFYLGQQDIGRKNECQKKI